MRAERELQTDGSLVTRIGNVRFSSSNNQCLLLRSLLQQTLRFHSLRTRREETVALRTQYEQLQRVVRTKAYTMGGVDRDQTASFLGDLLSDDFSLESFVHTLRTHGLTQPRNEVYCRYGAFPELPYSLFLVCKYVSVHSRWDSERPSIVGIFQPPKPSLPSREPTTMWTGLRWLRGWSRCSRRWTCPIARWLERGVGVRSSSCTTCMGTCGAN